MHACKYVCMHLIFFFCVCEREREKERERGLIMSVFVAVPFALVRSKIQGLGSLSFSAICV